MTNKRLFDVPGQIDQDDPNIDVPFSERVGDCYMNAAQYFVGGLGLPEERLPDGARLVHGTIHDGRGSTPIRHAWVDRGDGTFFEPTSGHRLSEVDFKRYFNPSERVRYTMDEARKNLVDHEHYGAWDEVSV